MPVDLGTAISEPAAETRPRAGLVTAAAPAVTGGGRVPCNRPTNTVCTVAGKTV
jgi:hypothetical protein